MAELDSADMVSVAPFVSRDAALSVNHAGRQSLKVRNEFRDAKIRCPAEFCN
jgi:hypothetical protein